MASAKQNRRQFKGETLSRSRTRDPLHLRRQDRNADHTALHNAERRERYARRKASGRCPRCGGESDRDGACRPCLDRAAQAQRTIREWMRA